MLTEMIWKALAENQNLRQTAPAWVNELLDRPIAEIQKLSDNSEDAPPNAASRPRLQLEETTTSYLDFLRREIGVRGRFGGEKIAKIYQSRLDALVPYEHKQLYWLHFLKSKERSLHIVFRPDDFGIVHIE